jgi:hypothetical protein
MALTLFAFFRTGPFSARIQSEERDRAQRGIELLQPGPDTTLPRHELLFRWRKIENIDSYVLELFDSTLARIWRSDFVVSPKIVPPPGVLAALQQGGRYFWMITGYDRSGRAIESDLGGFRILD